MGDRAIAEIRTQHGSLYFYTHSAGFFLPEAAQTALQRAASRRGDHTYAMKIVVDQLIRECGGRDEEFGGGLMLRPDAEDEYNHDDPSVVIDLLDWQVTTFGHHCDRDVS